MKINYKLLNYLLNVIYILLFLFILFTPKEAVNLLSQPVLQKIAFFITYYLVGLFYLFIFRLYLKNFIFFYKIYVIPFNYDNKLIYQNGKENKFLFIFLLIFAPIFVMLNSNITECSSESSHMHSSINSSNVSDTDSFWGRVAL